MEKRVFLSLTEYGQTDGAGTYRSTAGSQAPVDPELLDAAIGALERDGYLILEGLIPAKEIEAIRAEVLPLLPDRGGRNNFEGFATERVYAVIEKTFACNPLVEHPFVLGLLDRILEPNYLLSQLQVVNLWPGEAAQPIHYDDAFYRWPRPRRPLGAATIIPLDAFTEENGATVVIPGSHLWPELDEEQIDRSAARSAVMPPGSALFMLGTLWHHAGANRSNSARACVTAQYCAPWCRQQENYSLAISRERVKACSEHVQRLLGYSVHPPLMGFVNGMHPKRVLG